MYCIITGASRGIGRELAILFAKAKYNLILTCKSNIQLLNDLKVDLEANYNIKVITKKGHLSIEDIQNIDDINILINNASVADYNLLQDVSIERYNEIIDSNLTDAFLACKYTIPCFIKRKEGLIVNISSMWGDEGASMEGIYSMTKGGIISLTKSLSKELSLSNVFCICMKLGYVDTDMNNHLSIQEKEEIISQLKNKSLIHKNIIAKKIYDIILYKKYINGEIIDLTNK